MSHSRKRRSLLAVVISMAVLTAGCSNDVSETQAPSIDGSDEQPTQASTSPASGEFNFGGIVDTSICQTLEDAPDEQAEDFLQGFAGTIGYRLDQPGDALAECRANRTTTIGAVINQVATPVEMGPHLTCERFTELSESEQLGLLDADGRFDLAKVCGEHPPSAKVWDVMDEARTRPSFDEESTCQQYLDADEWLREEVVDEALHPLELDSSALATECGVLPDENLFATARRTMPLAWIYTTPSGFSESVELNLTSPQPNPGRLELTFRNYDENDAMRLDEACSIDDERDAAIRISAEITNTTSDYNIAPAWGFHVAYVGGLQGDDAYQPKSSLSAEERILVAKVFSGGDSICRPAIQDSGAGGYGIRFSEPEEPGSSITDDLLLVLKDYYGPAAPQGDVEMLEHYALQAEASESKTGEKLAPDHAPDILLNGDRAG